MIASIRFALAYRRADIRWGIRLGLVLGGFYCVLASALVLIGGAKDLTRHSVELPLLWAFYLGAGIFGGAVVGSMRRHLKNATVAAVLGFVIACPLYAVISAFADGRLIIGPKLWVGMLLYGLLFGAPGALILHWRLSRRPG